MTHIKGSEFQRPSASPAVGLVLTFFGSLGFTSPWGEYVVGYGLADNGWKSFEALYKYDKFSNGPFFTLALSSCVIALGIYIIVRNRQGKPYNSETIGILAMIIGVLLFATGYFTHRALDQLFSEELPGFGFGQGIGQGIGLWASHVVSIVVILTGLVVFLNHDLTAKEAKRRVREAERARIRTLRDEEVARIHAQQEKATDGI
jgi:hypothetical protein